MTTLGTERIIDLSKVGALSGGVAELVDLDGMNVAAGESLEIANHESGITSFLREFHSASRVLVVANEVEFA